MPTQTSAIAAEEQYRRYASGDRGYNEDLMQKFQRYTKSVYSGGPDNVSELSPVVRAEGDTRTNLILQDTRTGNFFLQQPQSVHRTLSDADAAYDAFQSKFEAQEAPAVVKEEEPFVPEQGAGFRSTIKTGGSGLGQSTPDELWRAGRLLSSEEGKDSYIIA